jgi:holo-[acyl-carrier protein] synthase
LMATLRTGIDLIEINRLEDQQPVIRQRFLERVFTRKELSDCGDSFLHLSGRFAAKEAVAKALGTGIGLISWQDIEILKQENGEPLLNLKGKAFKIAEEMGLTQWSISISHSKTYAVAVAVAIGSQINFDEGH